MSNFVNIFWFNTKRIVAKRNYLIICLILNIISISLAVYFTSKMEVKANIAVISSQNINVQSNYVKITKLAEKPKKSELVMNKYDAVVIDKGNREYDIETIKGESFKNNLMNSIKNPMQNSWSIYGEKRGVGTNILGYLIMVILMEGFMFMVCFTEDKESGTFKRILISPSDEAAYFLAQCFFNFLIIYVPAFLIMIIAHWTLGMDIGFSLVKYSYMLAILAFAATCFGLFMCSIIEKEDNAMALSASIIVITSLLSGSFYSFNNSSSIIKFIISIIPQKQYMYMIQGIENGHPLINYMPQFFYVMILAVAFIVAAAKICKRRFNLGRY